MAWTILNEFTHGRRYYDVQCGCGIRSQRRADHVDSGRTSCCKKCSAKATVTTHPNGFFEKRAHAGVGGLTRTFWGRIKSGADRRGIPFSLTIEDAWALYLKQGERCALSGVPINLSDSLKNCNPDYSQFTASLDRIDSSLGYEPTNVQWVHKTINYIKRDLPDQEFQSWCRLVSERSPCV